MRPRPRILVLGHARHGKDTVADILSRHHGRRCLSTSLAAAQVVRLALSEEGITYESDEACYADRVNHRAFWFDTIADLNDPDPATLVRHILEYHDVVAGLRSAREFGASAALFDAIWWVDASGRGVPTELTSSMDITFDPERMTLVDNGGSFADLERKVASAMADAWIAMAERFERAA
jgi:hypothetical protein